MTVDKPIIVGVLALQGAFIEHINHFEKCKTHFDECFEFIQVRTPQELATCDALVIPGGESTSISLIAERTGMLDPLYDYVKSDKPIWGTCAGLIFLSEQIINGRPGQHILGGMSIQVKRNAFGRQLDSFNTPLDFSSFIPNCTNFPTTFIRAPVITKILTDEETTSEEDNIIHTKNDFHNPHPVEILHKLDNGFLVAVKQGNKLGTSFHPELSDDISFHKWFLHHFIIGNTEQL